MDALTTIRYRLNPTHLGGESKIGYIIEGEIRGCFDNIDHRLLMERLRKRIADRKVLRLIPAFLRAGIEPVVLLGGPIDPGHLGGIADGDRIDMSDEFIMEKARPNPPDAGHQPPAPPEENSLAFRPAKVV